MSLHTLIAVNVFMMLNSLCPVLSFDLRILFFVVAMEHLRTLSYYSCLI